MRLQTQVRHGYTLAEMLVATAVTGILLAGMGSVVYIASQAARQEGPAAGVLRGTMAVQDLLNDLHYAIDFAERGPWAVRFTVADRTGDDVPETIRYAWSGKPGDPLTRKYNSGSAAVAIGDVHEFALTYGLKTATEESPSEGNEGPEILLAGHLSPTTAGDFAMTDKIWIGQFFRPAMPPDAVSWRVTRVRIMARVHGGNKGITAVQLRTATASNLPGSTVLEQVPMYESSLTTGYLWQDFSFSSVSGLQPGQGLCLVLACQKKDAHLADLQFDNVGGTARLTTTNAGSSWSSDASKSMLYAVHGRVTTAKPSGSVVKAWLQTVGIRLRTGSDPAAAVRTAVQVLNAPEVPPP